MRWMTAVCMWMVLICPTWMLGQEILTTQGTQIVDGNGQPVLLRGMGLGGWMLQEGYMLKTAGFANAQHEIRDHIEALIGTEATDAFYAAWLENHVTEADVSALKAWGFNSVRLPMHYNLFTLPIEEEPIPGENTWLELGFALTDSLVSWCAEHELYVILDLHAAPGGQGYDAGISDYDPSKPSLWESQENRDKMAALWKLLAMHYADEPWVAGYDLLNEPNWNLPGGTALRNLYEQVTDSIRSVDPDHILFIEGNWFANDFTGLTPPWDPNMVYSPHKYWSHNDVQAMQFALDLRSAHNVPLYLGESGENSNVWFRDAIALMEGLDMGWAWWPMKKVDDIAGPLSIHRSEGYQALLDYWEGNGPEPTAEAATDALMDLAEGLKLEHCTFRTDVIDAMFRQVSESSTVPFATNAVPGVVYATDFDLGRAGEAYADGTVANYHVSTGNFTAWNNGWTYRNDGVDIEPCTDAVASNGYSVGWLAEDEWMKYTVEVATAGLYDVHVRVASESGGGALQLTRDGTALCAVAEVPATGGWATWQTLTLENVLLEAGTQPLVCHVLQGGFNLSSFDFTLINADPTSVPQQFVSAVTVDPLTVDLTLNKPIAGSVSASPAGFTLHVNGLEVPITSAQVLPTDAYRVRFEVENLLTAADEIHLSYSGNAVQATDGTALESFVLEDVLNTLDVVYAIPGWIEAEGYSAQSGVELENTTDTGGGQNVGFLDAGDVLEYQVFVTESGTYTARFRTASESAAGAVQLQLVDANGTATSLGAVTFAPTGGWQTWATTTAALEMPAGSHTLRVLITQAPFNLNWMAFDATGEEGPVDPPNVFQTVQVYPNPAANAVTVEYALFFRQELHLSIYDPLGRPVYWQVFEDTSSIEQTVSLDGLAQGLYYVLVQRQDGTIDVGRFIKAAR